MAAITDTTPGRCQAVNDPSRRRLVGGTVLAALACGTFSGTPALPNGGAACLATGGPDAELIGLCARCDALQDRIDALHVRPADDMAIAQELAWEQARDLMVEPISDHQELLFEQICALRVTTLQGQAARARTLLGWDKDLCWTSDSPCWSEQLIGAVVRDLAESA